MIRLLRGYLKGKQEIINWKGKCVDSEDLSENTNYKATDCFSGQDIQFT